MIDAQRVVLNSQLVGISTTAVTNILSKLMLSRRDFISAVPSTIGTIALLPTALSNFPLPRPDQVLPLSLFFNSDRVSIMRSIFESNPAFDSLRFRLEAVDRDQMRNFIRDEVRYNDQLFHIKSLSDTGQALAFYYLLTGDRDAADLSAECIRSIVKFDKWDYFLEDDKDVVGIQRASSSLVAVAVASDWLGDTISDDERDHWLTVMKEKGCEPCYLSTYGMRYPDRVKGWTRDPESTYFEHRPYDREIDLSRRHIILNETNLKAVPASALAIGAAAYRARFGDSEETARWVEQAVHSLQTFANVFERDGSYPEGVSYGNYTALNIATATSILSRHGLADLTDDFNWPGYADYNVGLSMPTNYDPYDFANFGDNGNRIPVESRWPQRTAVSLWTASRFNDSRAQWYGLTRGGHHDEWALMWYEPSIPSEAPEQHNSLWSCDLDWIVARTGYRPADLTVAMRSGGPGNHEHGDRNSIIVKDFGEQLVIDPNRPPYSFKDPSWMMRTTAGHSALLIDGKSHQYHDGTEGTNASDAEAKLVRKYSRDDYAMWTSDATPAYQMVIPDVKSVSRSVFVIYDEHIVAIVDKVIKSSDPSAIEARYFGYNYDDKCRIESEGSSFATIRPGATCRALSAGNAGVVATAEKLPIPEDVANNFPFASVKSDEAALSSTLVTVMKITPGSVRPDALTLTRLDNSYTYKWHGVDGPAELVIKDSGVYPEFILASA